MTNLTVTMGQTQVKTIPLTVIYQVQILTHRITMMKEAYIVITMIILLTLMSHRQPHTRRLLHRQQSHDQEK